MNIMKISKLISILSMSISLLILLYVIYRAEIIHSGNEKNYYIKYYFFAILINLVSFLSFFAPDKFKIKISIIIFIFLVSIYFIETYLFIDSRDFRIWKAGIEYDKRHEVEAYIEIKNIKPNIKMAVAPSAYIHEKNQSLFPLSGISNKETILCNEHGYNAIYSSDRYGFNNPDYEWDKKQIDFLLIGDSFTQGACVNTPDSIAGILRKSSNDRGVISLAYTGNGSLIEYATLREYLPLVKPKNVIWLYYENDLWDLIPELNNQILLKYLNDKNFTQNLKSKQNEINILAEEKLSIEENKYKLSGNAHKKNKYSMMKFLKLFNFRVFIKTSLTKEMKRIIVPEFKEIIKSAKEEVEKKGSNFYFIYIPEYKRYKKNLSDDFTLNDYNKVINFVKSLDIPIIDLNKEVFKKQEDPLSLYPFRKSAAGFGPKVNQLITDIIYKNIKTKD